MADSDETQLSYHKGLSQDIDNASDSDEIQQSPEATNATTSSINHDIEEETKNETEQLLSESHDNSNLAITGHRSSKTNVAVNGASVEDRKSPEELTEDMKINANHKQQGICIFVYLTYQYYTGIVKSS